MTTTIQYYVTILLSLNLIIFQRIIKLFRNISNFAILIGDYFIATDDRRWNEVTLLL
jgi:hypothetical protein